MKTYLLFVFFLTAAFTSIGYSQQQKINYRRDVPRDSVFLLPGPYSTIHRSGNTVWTELNPKVPRVTYLSTYFCNKDTGWCVGDGGAIIKTTNGGESWSTKASNTVKPLLCVQSFDGRTVISTGYDGTILLSTDEGENWSQVQSNATSDLWSVQMTGRYTGWICGLNSALLKTTDGGLSWEHISAGFPNNYWALKFIGSTGYITCSNGNILKTTDTGLTWNQKSINYTNKLYCLYMFDSSSFMAAGYGGIVARTIDGGETFTYNYAGDNINSITFANDSVGCIFYQNSSSYCRTTNAGTTWVWTACNNIGDYCGIFINDSIAYNCGDKIKINKSTNIGASWNRLIINDDFNDIFFVDENKGFIGGAYLYRTTDAGLTWETNNNYTGINRIHFINKNIGFFGNIRIFRTTNSGDSWLQTTMHNMTDSIGLINKLLFVNNNTGWAVTSRGLVYKTINNGLDWYNVYEGPILNNLNSIYFLDSLKGWIVGDKLTLKTTDGGNNWIRQNYISLFASFTDIYFKDSLNGWIADNGLRVTTDGGNSWNLVNSVGVFNGRMQWKSNGVGYIYGGNVYKTSNWGNVWILDYDQNDIQCFYSFSHGTGLAGGNNGLIKNFYDPDFTPVELKSFNYAMVDGKINLYWTTVTETNNQGFEIQISINNSDLRTIGFVKGKGTTISTNDYNFMLSEVDCNMDSKIKIRLVQIDYNGNRRYYPSIEVKMQGPEHSLSNYPNPFNSATTISYTSYKPAIIKVIIYNVLGKEVKTIYNNKPIVGSSEIYLNLNELSSGVYIYRIYFSYIDGTNSYRENKMVIIK